MAGCATTQADHQQDKSQAVNISRFSLSSPLDQLLPCLTPQIMQRWDYTRRKEKVCITVEHGLFDTSSQNLTLRPESAPSLNQPRQQPYGQP